MPYEEEIKKILDKIDLNKDGKIEYDEFKTFLRNLFKEILDEY
jgi:Ca2+-binding EF-hand superfamily protein